MDISKGQSCFQSKAVSKAWDTRKTVDSSNFRPMIIIPIGRPTIIPHGMLIAGCPEASKGQVLLIISSARAMYSSRGQPDSGIRWTFIAIDDIKRKYKLATTPANADRK